MKKIILTYGLISGAVIIGIMIFTLSLADGETGMAGLEWLGYLTMILALSLVFIGIKNTVIPSRVVLSGLARHLRWGWGLPLLRVSFRSPFGRSTWH